MKNIALVILAFVLALTFTASDIGLEKANRIDTVIKCPYIQNLQENHSESDCPYLNGSEGKLSCPYMQKDAEFQTQCPYLEGHTTGECPYLKEKGEKKTIEINYYPLPEVKNS